MSKLSTYFIKRAKEELSENEIRKNESIKLFEEWLKNHPFIKYENPDLIHLLMFLRSKKFKMNQVFESFERSHIYLKSISEYTDLNDEDLKKFLSNCNRIFRVAKDRNETGEKILIIRLKEVEELELPVVKFVKTIYLVITALLFEEETQIAGVVLIFDYKNVTWNLLKKITLSDFSQYLINTKYFAVRMKQIILIDLPTFAVQLLELMRKILSEKLKQRIIVVKELTELKNILKVSDIFKENEYNEEKFLNIDEKIVKAYHMFTKVEVDFSKVQKFENIGSFRKLEID